MPKIAPGGCPRRWRPGLVTASGSYLERHGWRSPFALADVLV
jgi:hypothetical protein